MNMFFWIVSVLLLAVVPRAAAGGGREGSVSSGGLAAYVHGLGQEVSDVLLLRSESDGRGRFAVVLPGLKVVLKVRDEVADEGRQVLQVLRLPAAGPDDPVGMAFTDGRFDCTEQLDGCLKQWAEPVVEESAVVFRESPEESVRLLLQSFSVEDVDLPEGWRHVRVTRLGGKVRVQYDATPCLIRYAFYEPAGDGRSARRTDDGFLYRTVSAPAGKAGHDAAWVEDLRRCVECLEGVHSREDADAGVPVLKKFFRLRELSPGEFSGFFQRRKDDSLVKRLDAERVRLRSHDWFESEGLRDVLLPEIREAATVDGLDPMEWMEDERRLLDGPEGAAGKPDGKRAGE